MSAEADLSFATTDELVEELLRRYANVILAADKPHKTGAGQRTRIHWRGNINACIGLAVFMQADMVQDSLNARRKPIGE